MPKGMPGFDTINPDSQWLPADGDLEQAKQLMSEVANPKKDITLLLNDSPGHREIAVAIQAAWKELGIDTHDQAAGVGAVPRVPRPAAGQVGRRLPARLDRRLRRRDQLPRALDLRLGEQQHELLQQGATTSWSTKARQTKDNDARYELYSRWRTCSSARTATCRSCRSTGTRTSSQERADHPGHVRDEPARPDRPDARSRSSTSNASPNAGGGRRVRPPRSAIATRG